MENLHRAEMNPEPGKVGLVKGLDAMTASILVPDRFQKKKSWQQLPQRSPC
jgi:hypothetical protein